ncbi:MAG: hypothetical protein H6712_24690 [Myxococcales bacterium]|nr:hypothetical protein [Myxococcales bacterium]MCB9717077.1 hypothetical protein [Myxococcales bacterium]
MKKIIMLSVAALSLSIADDARANGTPDFETPSAESICDGYEGKAWGLCNAYCEAMDCELANDGDPSTEPNASAQACSQVASKFDQVSDGALLPCEVPACPCFAYDGFISAIDSSSPDALYCTDDATGLVSESLEGAWGVGIWDYGDIGVCGWYDYYNGYDLGFAEITSEEAQACMDAVRPDLYASGACGPV